MDRIPEPHELAEAHFAELEERRARMVADATCGDCGRCTEAPDEWSSVPHGWCETDKFFTRLDQRVEDYCDFFEER